MTIIKGITKIITYTGLFLILLVIGSLEFNDLYDKIEDWHKSHKKALA